MSKTSVIGLIILGAIIFLASTSIFVVRPTQQVIVMKFGNPQRTVLTPGLNFKIPIVEQAYYLDSRIMRLDTPPQELVASDQKRLVVDAFARFRIADPLKTYQSANNEDGASRLLSDVVVSTTREVLGRQAFPAIVSGERAALMLEIRERVNAAAQSFGVEVVDVRLKRVDLPEANSEAIYNRMKTERQREAREARAEGQEQAQRIRANAERRRTILLAEAERQAQITRGEGDGQAVKIFADAFGKDIEFFEFYRSMQAYRKALGTNDTTLVLSPDSKFFKLFLGEQGN